MKTLRLVIVLIPFIIQCQRSYSPEISQWRGPDRSGYYPDKDLLKEWPEEGPELLWTFEDMGLGYSSVAVTKERIFTSGTFDSSSYLIALGHDGNLIWKKKYGKSWTTNFPGVRSTPVIYDNQGYLLSGMGKLFCFSVEDGTIIWSKDIYSDFDGREVRFGLTENLLIDGNTLYCTPGGIEANVIALDRNTGDLIWKSKGIGEKSAYCSPIIEDVNGKRMFLTITAKSIISLDPENGDLFWSHDLNYPHGIHGNSPVYSDGFVFAMNGWEHGSVMLKIADDGHSVEEVWRSNLFDLEHGDVLLIGGNIYGTDYTTKHFACVDWKTGKVKDSIKEFAPASVIAADGLIYAYTYSGEVALIKPKPNGFELVSSFKAVGKKRDHIAHPVINDGKLYLRYSNILMVYSISNR